MKFCEAPSPHCLPRALGIAVEANVFESDQNCKSSLPYILLHKSLPDAVLNLWVLIIHP